jgi:poly-gamma-glutamate synthesis protein (capsule biosynthesis protein)
VHWGTELQDWPDQAQRAAAEWLVDHGADLVIGHHPHVVQQPGCVHGRPVFYSLGNLVFDQRYPETKTGLVADCWIRGGRLRCGGIQTHARRGSATPVVSGASDEGALHPCNASLTPPLTVSGYSLRPEPWSASASDDGLVIEGWKEGSMRWRSRRVNMVALQPGLMDIGGGQLILALERHPSSMDEENAVRPHVYAVGDHGLVAKWRGTALAWPLIDAVVDANGRLCALHRGDSFLRPDPATPSTRVMLYRWNGFGFSADDDSAESASCAASMGTIASNGRGGSPTEPREGRLISPTVSASSR